MPYLCTYNVLICPSTGKEKEVHRTEALKTSRSRKNPFFTASSYLYIVVRFLRSDFLCFSALNHDLFATKEGNLYARTHETSKEQLS
jgi:hypothetical protein